MNEAEVLVLLIFCSIFVGISCYIGSFYCCSKESTMRQNLPALQAQLNIVNFNGSTDSGIFV